MPLASLHIGKEALKFSAAHFTIFSATEAERLHGHNYHVTVDVWGDPGGEGLIIDAGEIKRIVKRLCDDFDEHVLLPKSSPHLRFREVDADHVEVRYSTRCYQFPCDDCVMLPVPNITIESLSQLLAERMAHALRDTPHARVISRLRVGVEESRGQMGLYELDLH